MVEDHGYRSAFDVHGSFFVGGLVEDIAFAVRVEVGSDFAKNFCGK